MIHEVIVPDDRRIVDVAFVNSGLRVGAIRPVLETAIFSTVEPCDGGRDEYPVALEGALKLKEISYIHAEAYPAGELKHGPLALVDADMPVIAVAPNDHLLEKLKSNIHEVRARGGKLIVFADVNAEMDSEDVQVMPVATTLHHLAPVIYTIPLQLLAYHVAVIKGTDVDQPRNLAKSVTVE